MSLARVAPWDVMRAAGRAIEVNVDLDVVDFGYCSRLILATFKRLIGEEDGEAEGMGDERWFVFPIGFDTGW